jgi:predicted Zn-dependent peptidase
METRFQVHPARYPVIGYKELVQKVTRDDLVRYYQRMYTPNNMLVGGGGRCADVLLCWRTCARRLGQGSAGHSR